MTAWCGLLNSWTCFRWRTVTSLYRFAFSQPNFMFWDWDDRWQRVRWSVAVRWSVRGLSLSATLSSTTASPSSMIAIAQKAHLRRILVTTFMFTMLAAETSCTLMCACRICRAPTAVGGGLACPSLKALTQRVPPSIGAAFSINKSWALPVLELVLLATAGWSLSVGSALCQGCESDWLSPSVVCTFASSLVRLEGDLPCDSTINAGSTNSWDQNLSSPAITMSEWFHGRLESKGVVFPTAVASACSCASLSFVRAQCSNLALVSAWPSKDHIFVFTITQVHLLDLGFVCMYGSKIQSIYHNHGRRPNIETSTPSIWIRRPIDFSLHQASCFLENHASKLDLFHHPRTIWLKKREEVSKGRLTRQPETWVPTAVQLSVLVVVVVAVLSRTTSQTVHTF